MNQDTFSLSLCLAHAHSYLFTNHDQLHISCDVFNFCSSNKLFKDPLIIYIMSDKLMVDAKGFVIKDSLANTLTNV
jgi:hypothetical protein